MSPRASTTLKPVLLCSDSALSLRGKGNGVRVLMGLVLLLAPNFAQGAETTYKIRIGFPSLAFSYMPFYVAQEKGIYKKYNIESEYIQMGTTIQPQAVVAGNINYFTSVSTGISAAVAGLPLVIVISFCDSSPWVLVTSRDINKPEDLIGKTVALSGVRTSPYYFFQAFLKKSEINEKAVNTINTGGTADSFRALTSNRVAATVLTPLLMIKRFRSATRNLCSWATWPTFPTSVW